MTKKPFCLITANKAVHEAVAARLRELGWTDIPDYSTNMSALRLVPATGQILRMAIHTVSKTELCSLYTLFKTEQLALKQLLVGPPSSPYEVKYLTYGIKVGCVRIDWSLFDKIVAAAKEHRGEECACHHGGECTGGQS